MTTKIQPGVRRRLESPDSESDVTLLVGVSGPQEAAAEQVSSFAEVEEELPYGTLAVTVSEKNLEKLCNLACVESVEIEGTWQQADDPNLQSPAGSAM